MAELSPLRRRMIEDMTIRNLSPATQRSYISAVSKFSRHFRRSPDRLGLDEVRDFQVHLVAKGVSWGSLKQRNTEPEKAASKAGKSADEIWPDEPNKAAQKDVDARWTLKVGGKVRYRPDGTPLPMIAIPSFGYKSHIALIGSTASSGGVR